MRFIKMTGGLGNQMFIYAFYMRMKKHYSNTRIDLSDMVHYKAHNGYEMHRVFKLTPIEFRINQPLKKVIEFLFFKKIYERKQVPSSLVPYDKKYFWPLLYFKGFYQSERFFADMADDIRKAFTFNLRLSNKKTKEMSEQIDHDENAVSIHVRRGDYLEPKYWKTTGCVCQLPYYLNAIAEMNKRISQPSYYVFSDDIAEIVHHSFYQRILINHSPLGFVSADSVHQVEHVVLFIPAVTIRKINICFLCDFFSS